MKPTIRPGDYHVIVNDKETAFESELKIFDSSGKLLHTRPCLAKGQVPNYRLVSGDTPPGLYRIGLLTVTAASESVKIWNAYGKYFFDLEGLQQNEEKFGRAGCGIHGGGSGSPEPLAAYQQLMPTLGCIRMFNKDLETILLPIYKQTQKSGNTIYVTVNQF